MSNRGIIYIAVNPSADTMAERSAQSVKAIHGDSIAMTLFTDQNNKSKLFDQVIKIPTPKHNQSYNRGIIAKAKYYAKTPYQYTLYLDMDTYVCGSLEPLFSILKDDPGYDIAACIDEAYVTMSGLPDCVARYNAGVIAYRKNAAIDHMFNLFSKLFDDPANKASGNDEATLSTAIYQSGVRQLTLPPEYNCRFIFPYILRNKAVILHGRPTHDCGYDKLAKAINQQSGYRVMYQDKILATHQPIKGYTKY